MFANFVSFLLPLIAVSASAFSDDYCYHSADCDSSSPKWAGECKTGHHQSPIDFNSSFLQQSPPAMKMLEFNDGYNSKDFFILNNGHTIQLTLKETPTSNGKIWGYGMDEEYIFAQVHFHWGDDKSLEGSEHTVNGKRYPMEMHLVHYSSKYEDFAAAATSGDFKGLAVIGIFLQLGDENATFPSAFHQIAANLPLHFQSEATHVKEPLDLSPFLPPEGSNFFRYMGSLTTPNCTEAVEWSVMKEPVKMPLSFLSKFWEVLDSQEEVMGNNFRPVQPLYDNTVEFLAKSNGNNPSYSSVLVLSLILFLRFSFK